MIVLLAISQKSAFGQTTADCVNNLVVCGTTSLQLNSNGIGVNDFAEAGNLPPTCGFSESQSLWLKVPIAASGNLEFSISANNGTDDFDFAIYGPNVGCSNLGTSIRCSSTNPQAAGVPADTGLRSSETDTSEGPGALGNGFVSSLPVQAGEEYIILIDNFSRSNAGFNLTWSGTADISNPPVANQPANIEFCAPSPGDPIMVDLSAQMTNVINGQMGVAGTLHVSEQDALLGVNPIDPANFEITSATQTVYARVTADGSGCSDITDFQVELLQEPVIDEIVGASSVCPDVDDVPYEVVGAHIDTYVWTVDGGTIVSGQGTNQITVDWGVANDNAKVTLEASNASGCSLPPEEFAVKINERLEPEKPRGSEIVCFLDRTNARYEVPLVPSSVYAWTVENGTITSGNGTNIIEVSWDANATSGRVYFTETNLTISQCEGFSEVLDVQLLNEIVVSPQLTTPNCFGESNGAITLNISGGSGAKTVSWSHGATGATITDLTAGTYEYTITDEMNCEVTGMIDLTQPEVLVINSIDPIPTLCFDTSNGRAIVMASGGTGSYVYNWQGPGGTRQTISSTINNLARGTYTVEVADQNGCTATSTFTITSPPLLEPDLNALVNLPICPGSSDGIIQIDALGGTPDYQFFWTPNITQTGPTVSGLSQGNYNVRIVDANGCETDLDIAIDEFFPRVYIPTAFSPNGDGENDSFSPVVACTLNAYELQVYNQWGEVIFQTTDQGNSWDGSFKNQGVPDDKYTYQMFYRIAVNGQIFEENIKGSIKLFR